MYDVISSAKNTQWFTFPRLCTNYTYSHIADENVDFQTLPGRNSFVEFNKKSGFELLRTVNKNNLNAIQRMKKRQIEDLSCGAVSKLYGSELAIGLMTGFVKIFNIEKGDFMPFKFKPDKIGNSVIGLDYSSDDEYLAAVYESGEITLFGMKTSIKTNSFTLDGCSTLIRFHPLRKFALAAGSYQGAITILDIQSKKKIFFEKAAHAAPTRDISMFSSSQDIFVSCGFDSNINVYDLRKRTIVQQYTQSHPMSTISVSSCGTFCVGGNLKGDVISFDFRNMKEPIDTKRAHDSAVVRVAFVPSAIGEMNSTLPDNATAQVMDLATPLVTRPAPAQCGMESFMKFVDVCNYKDSTSNNDASQGGRDSWADMMPVRRNHNFSNLSLLDTSNRSSLGSMNRSELRLKRPSRSCANQSSTDEQTRKESSSHTVPEIYVSDNNLADDQKVFGNQLDQMIAEIKNNERPESRGSNHSKRSDGRRSTIGESFAKDIKRTNTSTPPNLRTNNVYSPRDNRPTIQLNGIIEEECAVDAPNIALRNGCTAGNKAAGRSDLKKFFNGRANGAFKRHENGHAALMQSSVDSIMTGMDQRSEQMEVKMKEDDTKFYESGLQGQINLHNNLYPLHDIVEKAFCMLIFRDEYALDYYQTRGESMGLKDMLKQKSNHRDQM